MSAAVCAGSISSISAAVPVTIGAAIDVPDSPPKNAGAGCAAVSSSPGAAIVGARRPSRVGPLLEKFDNTPATAPALTALLMYEPAVMTEWLVPGIEIVTSRLANGGWNRENECR